MVLELDRDGLLPAITFIFSRVGCEAAVGQLLGSGIRLISDAQGEHNRRLVDERCAALAEEDLGVLGYWDFVEGISRGFAAHHATTITSCKARDAKRKGKVERPFRQLREVFLPEVELDGIPDSLGELNRRAEQWLNVRVHSVPSRTTGELPSARLVVERPFLTALPRVRFDTDYVDTRRVHNIVPFVAVDGVRYSVPAEVLGQLVEVRRPVDADVFEIRCAGRVVATHQIGPGDEHGVVWDPDHHHQAKTIAMRDKTTTCTDDLRTDQRHLRLVPPSEPLELGDGDFDVPTPDLDARYGIDGQELA